MTQSVFRIRIQIQVGSWIRIQEGKTTRKKETCEEISCFVGLGEGLEVSSVA
jgi:hypothetical protein